MKKTYKKMKVSLLGLELEQGFLTGSKPIEMEGDIKVNDFADGNAQWISGGWTGKMTSLLRLNREAMKMMKKVSRLLAVLAMALVCVGLVSCEKDRNVSGKKAIGFNVNCATTKSAPITREILQSNYKEFLSAAFINGTTTPYYSAGEIVTCAYQESPVDGELCWVTGEYWPEDDSQALDFWSFAPSTEFDTSASGVTFDTESGNRTMTFTYKPVCDASNRTDASDQKDILVAYTGNCKYNDRTDHRIPVTFNHAMSAIRFKVGDIASEYLGTDPDNPNNVVITGLNLEGFADGGICTVKQTADAEDASADGYLSGSNMNISWIPNTTTCTYQQFYGKENVRSGQYLDGGDAGSYGDGIFMITPPDHTRRCEDGAQLGYLRAIHSCGSR